MLLGLIIALKHLIYLMALSKVVSYRHYFSAYTLIMCFENFGLVVFVATLVSRYAGAFGYADDIALIVSSIYSLEKMIITCKKYVITHCITFNPSKSKLMCFNTDSCHNVRIDLNNMTIVNTKHDTHFGKFILCDIYDRNIDNTVCDFYQKSHGLINEFLACDCITLDNLHRTYCMHMYSCELWNLNNKKIEAFRNTWRTKQTPNMEITGKSK